MDRTIVGMGVMNRQIAVCYEYFRFQCILQLVKKQATFPNEKHLPVIQSKLGRLVGQ